MMSLVQVFPWSLLDPSSRSLAASFWLHWSPAMSRPPGQEPASGGRPSWPELQLESVDVGRCWLSTSPIISELTSCLDHLLWLSTWSSSPWVSTSQRWWTCSALASSPSSPSTTSLSSYVLLELLSPVKLLDSQFSLLWLSSMLSPTRPGSSTSSLTLTPCQSSTGPMPSPTSSPSSSVSWSSSGWTTKVSFTSCRSQQSSLAVAALVSCLSIFGTSRCSRLSLSRISWSNQKLLSLAKWRRDRSEEDYLFKIHVKNNKIAESL